MKPPNHLIKESSPYLLQHAYNPVNWYPWSEEALQKARDEDKLILISVGYSACHWCHVMEHESFEDFEVAEVMNRFFVCIKVDREERPDIDQVYMSAVQLMTGRGGWPLNCFALPDGRPVYGGTYFPKKQWLNILLNLADMFKNDRSRFEAYASELTEGIKNADLIQVPKEKSEFDSHLLIDATEKWKHHLDNHDGGPSRAPKFPLPNNYLFLLRHAWLNQDESLSSHVKLTLKKMAYGGIFDQLGGGFARYSVDGIWKVPHFEKMLYDNAQLVSLYSSAYRLYQDPLYRDVVCATLNFINCELTGPEGNFYAALDADTEGEEGKFYVWKKDELEQLLGSDFDLFADYFNVSDKGFWEHENYILLRQDDDEAVAKRHGLTVEELRSVMNNSISVVLSHRNKRVKPGLDDKTLASWNALMITGYLDAYDAFSDKQYLDTAIRNINFILEHMRRNDGGLYHSYKNGKATVNGYLEDYAFVIQTLIRLYQCTFESQWLDKANELTRYAINHFDGEPNGLMYFTSDLDAALIVRKCELQDNVIPASSSQMAINLFQLGHYLDQREWIEKSKQMAHAMKNMISAYGSAWSNWLMLWQYLSSPSQELAICGSQSLEFRKQIASQWSNPVLMISGCTDAENIPVTRNRLVAGKTLIYHCVDQACKLPVESVGLFFSGAE